MFAICSIRTTWTSLPLVQPGITTRIASRLKDWGVSASMWLRQRAWFPMEPSETPSTMSITVGWRSFRNLVSSSLKSTSDWRSLHSSNFAVVSLPNVHQRLSQPSIDLNLYHRQQLFQRVQCLYRASCNFHDASDVDLWPQYTPNPWDWSWSHEVPRHNWSFWHGWEGIRTYSSTGRSTWRHYTWK